MPALWLASDQGTGAWFPAQRGAQLVGAAQEPVKLPFALARIAQLIAVPAKEIGSARMELGDAPSAPLPVDDAGTEKPLARAAEPAGRGHKRDRLLDALPIAAILLDPILKGQCLAGAVHGYVGDALAISRPLPAA